MTLGTELLSKSGEAPGSSMSAFCKNYSFPVFNAYHFAYFSFLVESIFNSFKSFYYYYFIFLQSCCYHPPVLPSNSFPFHFSSPISKTMLLHPQTPATHFASFQSHHSVGIQVSQ